MSDLLKVREEMGLALAHARLPGMGGLTRVNNSMVHEWLETLDKEAQKFRQLSLLVATLVWSNSEAERVGDGCQMKVGLEGIREAEKGSLRMASMPDGGLLLTWMLDEPLAPPAGTS
jgi:hypothetical protein